MKTLTAIALTLLMLTGCGNSTTKENSMAYLDETKIVASDGEAVDYFGASADVSTTKFVVGAHHDDNVNGDRAGAVYVYDLDGSNEVKIIANNSIGTATSEFFGCDVAVSESHILIGAYGANDGVNDTGAVYLYNLDGTNELKITPTDSPIDALFGYSVAISATHIVVGARQDGENYANAGAVYVYDLDGSNEVKIGTVGASSTFLGQDVAVYSNKILCSPLYDDNINGTNAGAVYLYDLDGSNEVKIIATDGADSDFFGVSVAISGTTIAVGSYSNDNINGTNAGAVYVYDLDGSNEVKIIATDGADSDFFGREVALNDTKVVTWSVYTKDGLGDSAGAVYMYDLGGDNEVKVTSGQAESTSRYGEAVALSGIYLVIGASTDSGGGAVYLYDIEIQDPTNYTYEDYIPKQAILLEPKFDLHESADTTAYRHYYANPDTITYGSCNTSSPNSLDEVHTIADTTDEYAIGLNLVKGSEVKVGDLGLKYKYASENALTISDASDFEEFHPSKKDIITEDRVNSGLWTPNGVIEELLIFDGLTSTKLTIPEDTRLYNFMRIQKDSLWEFDALTFFDFTCESIYVYFYEDDTLTILVKTMHITNVQNKNKLMLFMNNAAHLWQTVVVDFISTGEISIGGYLGAYAKATVTGETLEGHSQHRVSMFRDILSDGSKKSMVVESYDTFSGTIKVKAENMQEVEYALAKATQGDYIVHVGAGELYDQRVYLGKIEYDSPTSEMNDFYFKIDGQSLAYNVDNPLIAPDSTNYAPA